MSGYIGDGVPERGQFSMRPDGSVQTGPSDASMLCIFYKRAVHNPIKSAASGREIYEDHDYVRIQQPGETTQVVDRPAQDNDRRRWPAQWQAYAAGKDQVAEGTPLGLLFPRHPSATAMLQAIGIMTVEHLAGASSTAIAAIGMHGQDYVNYAQKYINGATNGAAFHQMQFELEQAKRDNTRLSKQVDDLTHQIAQIHQGMLAQAGVGVPMPGVPRQPAPPAAESMPGGSMPRAPSFGSQPVFDAQAAQINATHPSANSQEPYQPAAGDGEQPPRRGGWPKGKARGPRKTGTEAA
jgi:hypothetical protein